MKIVHLTDSMEVGGAEKLVSQLCRWQRQQGHDPSVHCLYQVGFLGEELRADGFDVVSHEKSSAGGRAASVFRELKNCAPEVVHCHNATAAIMGAIPARLAGARSVIVTRHGIVAPPYALRRELKFAFASRWCDWIVAVCDGARNNLMAAPFAARQKVVRIYNGTIVPHCNGTKPPSKSGFTLLHVGRLSPAKDQETLLRSFAIAKTQNPDLGLWVVGGGNLQAKLESLACQIGLNGSVIFFGEQADVSRFLAAADLFVLSSVTEGIPVSLLEALGAGVPAVVTDVGGMSEVAQLSCATVTVPPSSPAALAAAIDKMVQSCSQLRGLGKIAQECFAANFTLDRMANQYMTLYSRARNISGDRMNA
jgi:glycosyltransferase involved in cell wall biosynthesis